MSSFAVERIEAKQVTVTAHTAASSPETTTLTLAPGLIVGVEITIPTGHAGLTGLALLQAGTQVIPATEGDWLVADGVDLRYAVERFAESRLWSARAFNTDAYEHSFYLRFLLDELVRGDEAPGELLPLPL